MRSYFSGLLCGLYYYFQFVLYCEPKANQLPGTMEDHFKVSTFLAAIIILFAMIVPEPADVIGKLAVFFCVVLFSSPLSSIKNVITTKNANSIPLPFTLACILNCSLWTISGIFDMHDFNIYFPNLLGLLASLAQLVLIYMYRGGPSNKGILPR